MSINDYIQDVFQIVVTKDDQQTDGPYNEAIYVQFDITTDNQDILDEHLEAILFERLLMSKEDLASNKLRIKKKPSRISYPDEELNETNPFIYLYLCFQRVHSIHFDKKELRDKFKKSILNQANRYLCNIYPNLERKPLLVNLLDKCYFVADDTLLKEFIAVLGLDEDECDLDTLVDILQDAYYKELCNRVSKMEFSDPDLFNTINYIHLLTSNKRLSLAFIKLNSPWTKEGNNFNFDLADFSPNSFVLKTLIGHLLSISTLPKFNQTKFKYFNDAMNNTPDVTYNLEKSIGSQIFRIVQEVYKIFFSMLKQGTDVKEETLNYICLVLYCSKNRSRMWVNQFPKLVQLTDGFMLNFLHVLLLLCKPFSEAFSKKLLLIDPTYCAIPALQLKEINKPDKQLEKIHLRELDQDTFLIGKKDSDNSTATSEQAKSSKEDDLIKLKDSSNYNFITEIFFACHKAIQLAFKPCYDRFLSTASQLNELSRASVDGRIPNQEMFNQEMNKQLSKFYSTKTIICQDDFVELLVNFSLATATWLSNLAMYSDILDEQKINFSPIKEFYPFKLKVDLNLEVNSSSSFKLLQFIPEFLCESVTESLIFVQKFVNDNPKISNTNFEPLLTFILSFIASPHKMKNPHLRAKLAEVLEELIPKPSQSPYQRNTFGLNQDLYKNFEHKQYLIPCLIHVYVSIELTGQSVAFEQKFQYRRSIYEVIQYLWNEQTVCSFYRQSMKELSNEAIKSIENPKQPLFLRFINLMTNDATFVLDESLDHLSKLKQLQNEKESGKWNSLGFNERREKEQSLMLTERMCKWSNFNSKMMVTMLYYLTTEIKDIFCHEIYVERLAQMLNYFLEHLVGPKNKDYKVKSTKDVLFNPVEIVFMICRIYLNLGHPKNNKKFFEKFCLATISDSRSYSDKLLQSAIDVLWRKKGQEVFLIEQLGEVDRFNKELIEKVKKEEIDVKDVPEEFLDPILGTLIQNPVKLPSGYILDKSTIARHLLSDQTDPFTRQPLTLEMLVPEVELKSRIDAFVNDYYKNKAQETNEESDDVSMKVEKTIESDCEMKSE